MLLRVRGHEVRVAHSVEAALETSMSYIPDLVFLHIGMPAMDGYDVAPRIKQQPGIGKSCSDCANRLGSSRRSSPHGRRWLRSSPHEIARPEVGRECGSAVGTSKRALVMPKSRCFARLGVSPLLARRRVQILSRLHRFRCADTIQELSLPRSKRFWPTFLGLTQCRQRIALIAS